MSSVEGLRFHHILKDEGLDELEESVRLGKGKLQVLVHPFFREEFPDILGLDAPGYRSRRDRFIQACLKNRVPLLIFEEELNVDKLAERINHPGDLFVVETEPRTSRLANKREMHEVGEILRQSGVEEVCVGGKYMELKKVKTEQELQVWSLAKIVTEMSEGLTGRRYVATRRWLEPQIYTSGCAGGIVIQSVIQGFDTSISGISSPDILKDFLTTGPISALVRPEDLAAD